MNNTATTTIALNIDDREVQGRPGQTVLETALDAGIYIPHLCHHPDLRPVGSCGLCLVEIEGTEGLLSSCLIPITEGMVVQTRSDRIARMRRLAMELLLADHPAECLDCSQYLNCELQSVKQYLGISEELQVRRRGKPVPQETSNPLFVHDFARCIRCGRCVRACNELRGIGVLSFLEHGPRLRVGTAFDRTLMEAGCRFCGACVEVCPTGAIRDQAHLVKGKKRKQALVPCRFTCPAEIDVPRYVGLIREGKYSEATAVIREKVPFPKILGHVCHHPCEGGCRRGEVNQPIAIRDLKLFAAENDTLRLWKKNAVHHPPTGQRVAVVGAGPAGLTAAACLALAGHEVTIFESMPEAGGMMRYGIPAYRLPRDVLEEEIQEIIKLGVTIKTNCKIERLDSLTYDQGFDAVLLALGAHAGQKLPIEGRDSIGVWDGLAFLRQVNQCREVPLGHKIVVLGGGNVAFDCARVARRLGAAKVTITCLESRDHMPASPDEIKEGEEEGITLIPGRTFTRILESDGRATGVECLEVASFEFDEDGQLELRVIENSEQVLEADTVIFAIGQHPEIPEDFDIEIDERGRIAVDPYTLDTSEEGIFAAGDAVAGTSSVIQAVASGREAAMAVDRFLGGEGTFTAKPVPAPTPVACLGPAEGFARLERQIRPCLGDEERLSSFCNSNRTLDAQQAAEEAQRCLQCDLRLRISPVKFWGDY